MSIAAIVVEDDTDGCAELRAACERDARIDVVAVASSAQQALAAAAGRRPDAVFIDIDLPELDATSLTQALRGLEAAPVILFATARPHLAITAFDLAVADCILKPTKVGRISQAIDRVLDAVRQRSHREAPVTDDLWLPRLGTMVRVPVSSIERVEAERDYARVWTPGGSFLLRTTMASIERRLALDDFIRIHRSTIVALDQIRGCRHVGGGAWAVIDARGKRHPVGRRHLATLRERLGITSPEGSECDETCQSDHRDANHNLGLQRLRRGTDRPAARSIA